MQDVQNRLDIDRIVRDFYQQVLTDPIIGFIFTDIARINLENHLPIIGDFWEDILFRSHGQGKKYSRNALAVHLELAEQIPLKPGHFTRWLFLFERAVQRHVQGDNADLMLQRAQGVAKAISAALKQEKKAAQLLTLEDFKLHSRPDHDGDQ